MNTTRHRRLSRQAGWLCALIALVGTGCDAPGKPDLAKRPLAPAEIRDFATLFKENCSGCHGERGWEGAAPPLADPLFLHLIDDQQLRDIISRGRQHTLMPPFASGAGGPLSDQQIAIIAYGLREKLSPRTELPARETIPTYLPPTDEPPALTAPTASHPGLGSGLAAQHALFARACGGCHGDDGRGGKIAGSVRDPNFLALISDQALRRIIITGRPDLGMPDYSGKQSRPEDFRPLTQQDVASLVALLASWRNESTVATASSSTP